MESLEVGELPGGDLNEVQREAHDLRELRIVGGGLTRFSVKHTILENSALDIMEYKP